MFEEPFRWMEAISTRHSYVREKLKKARPVLGVPYDEGAVILGFTPNFPVPSSQLSDIGKAASLYSVDNS